MATKIRGITIEIGGDTSPLAKALKGINAEVKDTQQQLKDVEKLLKFDPGNTEALRQKQDLLNQSVEDHKKKLEAVKAIQDQLNRTLADGGEVNQKQLNAVNREVEFLTKELEDAEKKAKDFNATCEKIGATAKEMGDKLTGAAKAFTPVSAAGAAVAAGLGAAAVSAGKSADDINTLAKVTGLSTEQIQKFAYASDLIDVSLDTLTVSMSKMIKNMDTARRGTGTAAEAFDALHVRISNADGTLRDSQDVFEDVIKKLGRMQNETERDAAAMAIFGKSARELNPLILGGAEALRELGDEAEKSGLILSQESLDGANALNDELDTLKATAAATKNAIGAELAAALLPLMRDLTEVLKGTMEWLRGLDGETLKWIATVALLVGAVAPVLGFLGQMAFGINQLMILLPKLGAAMGALKGITAGVGTALSGVGSFLLSWPGLILAIVVAIAIAGDDIQAALGKLDDFLKGIFEKDWTEVFGSAGEVVNGFFAHIQNLWDSIKKVLDGVIDFIRGVFTGDWERAWKGVSKIFEGVFGGLAAIAAAPINMVIGVINWLIDGLNAFFKWLNSIKLPDFLGGGSLFNLGEVEKLNYIDTSNLADSLFGAKKASASADRVINTAARDRLAQKAREREERKAAASQRAKLMEGQPMTINNYNSINADNLAQVARMEQTLNGQRQSIRAGYAGG